MQLVMYLGNDLIESMHVDKGMIPKPGYLGQIKRILKQKHQEDILQFPEPPEYYLVDLPPAPPSSRS
jgi:hypothetical protein